MENLIPKLIHYWVLNDELLNETNILNIHHLNKNYRILIHTTNKSIDENSIKEKISNLQVIYHNVDNNLLSKIAMSILYNYGGIFIKQKGEESSFQFDEFSFDLITNVMKDYDDKKICILMQSNRIIISKPKVKYLALIENIFSNDFTIEENFLSFFIIIPMKENCISNKESLGYNSFKDSIPFHVINLKHRPERYISFLLKWNRAAEKLNIKINRFDAFKHRDGNIRILNGCAQSHFEIVENELIKNNKNYVIVLEDDATINPKLTTEEFSHHFMKVIEYVEKNYDKFDILTLGTPSIVNMRYKEFLFEPVSENIAKISSFWQSHFLIYTKGIIPYFYKFFAEILLRKTIHRDQDSYFKFTKGIRNMITYPMLSYQDINFISDIINEYRQGDFYSEAQEQINLGLTIYNAGGRGNYYDLVEKTKFKYLLREWSKN
jgi:GR25 family glycosyltransferase involved in LPS biosynthesis